MSKTRMSLAQIILKNPYFLLFVGEFLLATAASAASVGLAIAVTSSSGNAAVSSAIIGLVSVPVLIVSPVVPQILQRFGFYKILVSTQVIAAIGMLIAMICFYNNFIPVVIGFTLVILLGLCSAIHIPAVYATLGWFVGEKAVPQAISSINLRTGLTWAVGSALGGSLVIFAHGAVLLGTCSALALLGVLPIWFQRKTYWHKESELKRLQGRDPACVQKKIMEGIEEFEAHNVCPLTATPTPGVSGFFKYFLDPQYAYIIGMFFVAYFFLGGFTILLTPWAKLELGAEASLIGFMLTVRSVSSIPGPFVVEFLLGKFGMPKTVTLSFIASAASVFLIVSQPHWNWICIACLISYGVFYFSIVNGLLPTMIFAVFGKALRVEAQSLLAFSKGISSSVTIGLGWLANVYGTTQILLGSISFGLTLLLFFRFVLRHRWNSAVRDYEASFAA